jgi:hypothetical protein
MTREGQSDQEAEPLHLSCSDVVPQVICQSGYRRSDGAHAGWEGDGWRAFEMTERFFACVNLGSSLPF